MGLGLLYLVGVSGRYRGCEGGCRTDWVCWIGLSYLVESVGGIGMSTGGSSGENLSHFGRDVEVDVEISSH